MKTNKIVLMWKNAAFHMKCFDGIHFHTYFIHISWAILLDKESKLSDKVRQSIFFLSANMFCFKLQRNLINIINSNTCT